eukprot:CAMPEP_0185002268 /NCGR_PEP_ID=MMETSP1098-20130426/73461_1 /TAXON_ID=89044 /ORGANISM="Spumella elongata, Strain CCAP 955/1" /LENGTH=125 /DNA_ID=CAMNT_0027529739 /DNA_START=23 /DNA_END=397 /DNA_ORIENTATION=+
MVVYKARLPNFLTPLRVDDYTSLYRPPVAECAEFEVELIELPPHTTSYHPAVLPCGAILLLLRSGMTPESVILTAQSSATEGVQESPLDLKEGAVVFTAARQEVSITAGAEGATFYRAHVNLSDK